MIFENTTGKKFTFNQMVNEVIRWTGEYHDSNFTYVVATDSQVHKVRRKAIWYTTYITLVWVHRESKGGRLFIIKDKVDGKIEMVKRLMRETELSIALMTEISESRLKDRIDDFSVHIDVGRLGKSKSVVESCLGWVLGMGWNAEIKPEAIGAYCCADRFSKGNN